MQKLAEAAIALSEKQHQPKKLDMPTYQQLFPSNGFDPDFPSVPAVKNDMDAVAAILHSSGEPACIMDYNELKRTMYPQGPHLFRSPYIGSIEHSFR